MKAREITEAGKEALLSGKYDVVRVNYANPGAHSARACMACLNGLALRKRPGAPAARHVSSSGIESPVDLQGVARPALDGMLVQFGVLTEPRRVCDFHLKDGVQQRMSASLTNSSRGPPLESLS